MAQNTSMGAAPAANPLATQPISRLILKFAVPGIITQLVNSVHNIVDQVFIGWGVGDLGIAATNITFPITSLITALSALIGLGAAARFSILLGKNQEKDAADVFGNALTMMVLSGGLLVFLTSLLLEPMLYLFGATDLMMPYAVPYARVICMGILFGIFSTAMSYFIRADGNPNFSSIVLLSGAVFNMIFDPVFLFIFDMGIAGVALATVLGQLLSAVLALWYLFRRFHSVSVTRQNLRLRWHVFKSIFSLGIAVFTTHILAVAVQIIQMNSLKFYGALSVYGSEIVIASSGAVSKMSIVFLSSIVGIAIGCQPIYGFNFGSRQYGRVRETYLTAMKYGCLVSVTAFIVLQVFARPILSIFGSDDPMFYEFALHFVRVNMALLFTAAVQPITSNFCTAMGRANMGFWMAVIRQGILSIPLLLILPQFLGIDGVLLVGPAADGIAAAVVLFVGRKELKRLRMMEEEQEASA